MNQLVYELMDCPCHPEPVNWNWFVENARLFDKVDKATSESLAQKYDCKVKECYYNTWKADITGKYTYYEGYAIRDDIPLRLAHSWLVDNNGKVLDPTLSLRNGYAQQYIGIAINRTWLNTIAFKLKRTGEFLPQWYEKEMKASYHLVKMEVLDK